MEKYSKVVIGIDQSYKRTGITVICDHQIKEVYSYDFTSARLYKNNTVIRQALAEYLSFILFDFSKDRAENKDIDVKVVFERIRLHSAGFVSIDYIKAMGALNAVIIDTAYSYGIPCYSVETKAWKSRIVGTSAPMENEIGIDPKKWPTIQLICEKGLESKIITKLPEKSKIKKGVFERNGLKYTYNDDAADSICIAMYGDLEEESENTESGNGKKKKKAKKIFLQREE